MKLYAIKLQRMSTIYQIIFFFAIGTMGQDDKMEIIPDIGSLYSIDDHFKPKKEISPVTISNGLAWNIEDNTFYYIDSPTRKIAAYDYNPHSGKICKRLWYILL